MNTKKALLNICTDAFGKLAALVVGIILPKLYIDSFGSEINGLLSSLAGIFVYINLLEGGVGAASIQALYSPLSQNKNDKVNGIMSATNKYYRRTGVYFLACISILSFLYPIAVKSNVKFSVIVALVFLSSVPSAIRFFFQGKYVILLNADNRVYILNLFSTIFNIISNLLKAIMILCGSNIIFVQMIFALVSILQVIAIYIYVRKKYPYINFDVRPNNEAISKKGSVMVHEVSYTIFSNSDVLLLTLFCNLKVVSVYTIYSMIFTQTGFLVKTISTGVTASFGQLYFHDNRRFKKLFNCFDIYYQAMVFAIFTTAMVLTTPFLKLYTAGVTDINYIDKYLPILFMIVNILSNVRWPAVIAINIAGHFKETQWRAVLEFSINLVVSTVLVIKIQIYGVLIGTIVALCYRTIDMIVYSNKYILNKKISKQIYRILLNGIIALILICTFNRFSMPIETYSRFILVATVTLISISLVYIVIASILERESRQVLVQFLLSMFKLINKGEVKMPRVSVIGLGYIGLPTALMFASHGVDVVGIDYNKDLIDTLQSGNTTFEENGLDDLFKRALENGIKFSSEYISTDIYIIAVPTPYDKINKKIDPQYVVNAVKSVMKVCPKGTVIVIESTISPRTIDKFIRPIIEGCGFKIGEDINIVHAPERIIPGNMIYELKYNSRTIGVDSKDIGEEIKCLYSTFCKGDIVITDIRTAEMTKVVENTFRDINIAFANELAKICRSDNMDVYEIIKIANMHPRVNILQPGPGVGGHCISVDPWFLVGDYPGLANIILAARKINDSMPEFVLERVHDIMEERGMKDTSRVGLYGLTYKEDVDDIRESPSIQLLECMEKHLTSGLKVYDPFVKREVVENQYYNFEEFLNEIDIIVIMVSHSHIKENMHKLKGKIILDTKNVCSLNDVYKL